MVTLFFSFICFGIIAMIDFWRWEYNYGHNLNPDAAIIVPGMAYQPPLIGFKQLLNFGAYSIPALGGWIFVSAGLMLLLSVVIDFVKKRKFKKLNIVPVLTLFISLSLLMSCAVDPQPIKLGMDNCQNCKMTISDAKYGAEIITKKGKIFKFDEINCLLSYIRAGNLNAADVKDYYFTDFCSNDKLVNQTTCFLMKSNQLKSPMRGNVAAFSNMDSLKVYSGKLSGETIKWSQILVN